MFPIKYVAVQTVGLYPNTPVRTFRTKRGAVRWVMKRIKFLGLSVRRCDIGLVIYEVQR